MGENGRGVPSHLAGGRDLGPQQIALTDIRFVAALNLSVVSEIGDVPLGVPCLRVIDLSTGKAMVAPVASRWLRQFAAELVKSADVIDGAAGVDSPGSLPIAGV